MRTKKRLLEGLVIGLLSGGSVSAQAVLSYLGTTAGFTGPGAAPDWTQTIALPSFNASLGTLTQVRLTYTGEVSQRARGENLTGGAAVYAYDLSTALTLMKGAGPALFSSGPVVLAGSGSFGAFDGGFDFSGPSAFDFTRTVSVTSALVDTSGPTLAAYTGLGLINFTATAMGRSGFTGPGNFISHAMTQATVGLEVEYTFTPIPEPGTYVAVMGGLVLVGTLAWRRRSGV